MKYRVSWKGLTLPLLSRILLLNSLPSRTRKPSSGFRIPHLVAIDLAVFTLSPVTIRTVIPACWHCNMDGGTFDEKRQTKKQNNNQKTESVSGKKNAHLVAKQSRYENRKSVNSWPEYFSAVLFTDNVYDGLIFKSYFLLTYSTDNAIRLVAAPYSFKYHTLFWSKMWQLLPTLYIRIYQMPIWIGPHTYNSPWSTQGIMRPFDNFLQPQDPPVSCVPPSISYANH